VNATECPPTRFLTMRSLRLRPQVHNPSEHQQKMRMARNLLTMTAQE
jgi:hypothetical protein